MRWSYGEYLDTPVPVIEEVVQWMRDLADEQRRERSEATRRRR